MKYFALADVIEKKVENAIELFGNVRDYVFDLNRQYILCLYNAQRSGEDCGCQPNQDCTPEKPLPPPPGHPAHPDYKPRPIEALDPNDIVGPEGFGDERWVRRQRLPYKIRFENLDSATAPAHEIVITTQIDPLLDYRTFRLGGFGFGDTRVDMDGSQAFLSRRVDLRETIGIYVDVIASIDVISGVAIWTLRAIDPATGALPASAAMGFLPPNDATGRGEGFVSYSIVPRSTVQSGDRINAQATITFDTAAPIETPLWTNSVDAEAPVSQIAALPANSAAVFPVAWSATEVGSALSHFDIYVSEDDGPFVLWLANTTLTSAPFIGNSNRRYAFYSIAVDNAGQVEAPPTSPDATTTTGSGPLAGDFNNDSRVDLRDLIILQNHLGMSGSATPADGDLNGDMAVNRTDAALFMQHYGTSAPANAPVAHAASGVLAARDRAFAVKEAQSPSNPVRVARAARTQRYKLASESRRVSSSGSSDFNVHDRALASEAGSILRAARIVRRAAHDSGLRAASDERGAERA
jgi:hypothetical protein